MLRFSLTAVPHPVIVAMSLNRFAGDIRTVRPALERAVNEVVRPAIEENFETQGSRVGGWEPLSASTRRSRISAGYGGGPILTRTARLRRSAQTAYIWKYTKTEAFVPSLPSHVFYGIHHQGGTRRMPARPFLAITVKDELRIEEVFHEWLSERAGLRFGL